MHTFLDKLKKKSRRLPLKYRFGSADKKQSIAKPKDEQLSVIYLYYFHSCTVYSKKYVDDAYVLAVPLGLFGLHHYYLENYHLWLTYMCTVGLCGIGWLIDLCAMPLIVAEANKELSASRIQPAAGAALPSASSQLDSTRTDIPACGHPITSLNPPGTRHIATHIFAL
jgi:TM2 domain